MQSTYNDTPHVRHAIKLIEDFFSNLSIAKFEGPQSNSGYKEYSDNMYYTKDTHNDYIRYAFGVWVLQTENMYGWDWRITIDIRSLEHNTTILLRRVDCLGGATDILVVANAKLESMDSLDETITMLLLQGAHSDHLSDLEDRGFSPTIFPDTDDNESPWDVFDNASKKRLAVAGITVTSNDGNYSIPSRGITKSFSTDYGDVNKFWLSTAVDQTYLTIWGMGFSFTVAKHVPITLNMVDKLFKHFFTFINTDQLSATTNGRYMANIYKNNLTVLGGLEDTVGWKDNEEELDKLFKHLVTHMETIAISKPDKVRFAHNRVGDVTGIFYYPTCVGESKPLRIWLTHKKIQHPSMKPHYIGTACLAVELSDPSSTVPTLFYIQLNLATNACDILQVIKDNLDNSNSDVDSAMIDEIMNHVTPT